MFATHNIINHWNGYRRMRKKTLNMGQMRIRKTKGAIMVV